MEDTTPTAARVYWDGIRRMSATERAEVGWELSQLADEMVRAGVGLRHPAATPGEFQYQVMRAKYGRELADKVCGRVARTTDE